MMRQSLLGSVAQSAFRAAIGGPTSFELLNPGAEEGDVGWTFEGGAGTTSSQSNGSPRTGTLFFYGGSAPSSRMYQTVSVDPAEVAAVDALGRELRFSYYQGSFDGDDALRPEIRFYDGSGALLDSFIGTDYSSPGNTWTYQEVQHPIPSGTRSFELRFEFTRFAGTVINAYIDDMSISYEAAQETIEVAALWEHIIFGAPTNATSVRHLKHHLIYGAPTTALSVRRLGFYAIVET